MQNNFFLEFINKHPLYKRIKYKNDVYSCDTLLHPILIYSQAIIDYYLSEGKKRIAIILPDDETNILPMITAKYFCDLQERPEYAHNVFEDIEEGQHLKLGKSVVEFIQIDRERNVIEFYAGKPTKLWSATKYISPLKNYYQYFERTNAAVSKEETFHKEIKIMKEKLATHGIIDFDLLSSKRTTLNKTIAVLSLKNEFKEYLGKLYIYNRKFSESVTYGEFDLNEPALVRLYNSGQLDCIPGLTVSSRINELADVVTNYEFSKNIEAIITTQSKYNDIINNTDELKKCLKTKIPFIVFVSETEFETFPILSELGFEFLRWDQELLNNCGFSSREYLENGESIFYKLSQKTYNAANQKTTSTTFKFNELKMVVNSIRGLLKKSIEINDDLRQFAFWLNRFYKNILDLLSPNQDVVRAELLSGLYEIKNMWKQLRMFYKGTGWDDEIENILDLLEFCLKLENFPKAKALYNALSSCEYENCCIIVPIRYLYKEHLAAYIKSNFENKNIKIFYPNEFYKSAQEHFGTVIVTFFDSNEYMNIKNTFCYDQLIYLLYDFENAWRSHYMNRHKACLPVDTISKDIAIAGKTNRNKSNEYDEQETELFYTEISDYNFERNIIKSILEKHNCSANQADSIECIPVMFNRDTVGYFNPMHSIIEISSLCSGDSEKPIKKESRKITKGDVILIRQSGHNIIFEKADELMARKGVADLRSESEKWIAALQKFSKGKEIDTVLNAVLKNGADCTAQQIRYWLIGDTICPEKISVLYAISKLCPDDLPYDQVERVYESGMKVQEYHREAGRWLSSELKNKAQEIKAIYDSGACFGFIDGIGEIQIYVVEEVLEREYINRGRINRVEVII